MLGSAYVASKFAVRGLTQVAGEDFSKRKLHCKVDLSFLAIELGKHGITVNAYAPGFIKTEMCESFNLAPTQVYLILFSERCWAGNEQGARHLCRGCMYLLHLPLSSYTHTMQSISKIAIPRIGETEDIAELVSFLVSKKAGYITGQTVSCRLSSNHRD